MAILECNDRNMKDLILTIVSCGEAVTRINLQHPLEDNPVDWFVLLNDCPQIDTVVVNGVDSTEFAEYKKLHNWLLAMDSLSDELAEFESKHSDVFSAQKSLLEKQKKQADIAKKLFAKIHEQQNCGKAKSAHVTIYHKAGAETWDTDKLTTLAETYPEILTCKKVGKPTCAIRID